MKIENIWLFIFVFSILYMAKATFNFFRGVQNETLIITSKELLFLGLAISYFVTYIIR